MFRRATSRTERAATLAAWLIPPALCVVVYRYALAAWFQQDDFVWLSLEPRSLGDLLRILSLPTPHGTLRPFSDRGFFLALKSMFGLNALPFHLAVFLFQFGNLALIASLVRRLTGSALAAGLAPVLWLVNPVLVLPMVWISGVYQVMGCFCFLLALRLFIAYGDTGRRSYLFLQWLVFVLGLGVIESIVVYPAMAGVFAALYARRLVKHALTMLVVSIAFVMARLTLVAGQTGPYGMHFDTSMVATLLAYWKLAAGASESLSQAAVAALVTAVLLAFSAVRLVRRDYLPIMFLMWFILPLAPVLPLRDHITGYYLMIPFVGVAALAAYAIARGWNVAASQVLRWVLRPALVVLTAGYCIVAVSATDFASRWWYLRSKRVQDAFTAVQDAHRRHPTRVILLADVDTDLFWSCIFYRPFTLAGIRDVYLVPGADAQVRMTPGSPPLSEWMIAASAARELQAQDRLVVLKLTNGHFVDVTDSWNPPGG